MLRSSDICTVCRTTVRDITMAPQLSYDTLASDDTM